jgi:hypothetical protein
MLPSSLSNDRKMSFGHGDVSVGLPAEDGMKAGRSTHSSVFPRRPTSHKRCPAPKYHLQAFESLNILQSRAAMQMPTIAPLHPCIYRLVAFPTPPKISLPVAVSTMIVRPPSTHKTPFNVLYLVDDMTADTAELGRPLVQVLTVRHHVVTSCPSAQGCWSKFTTSRCHVVLAIRQLDYK